eukprot:1183522-Prorocentrum_minimum.AAC.1
MRSAPARAAGGQARGGRGGAGPLPITARESEYTAEYTLRSCEMRSAPPGEVVEAACLACILTCVAWRVGCTGPASPVVVAGYGELFNPRHSGVVTSVVEARVLTAQGVVW